MTEPRLLTVEQVCKRTGLSESTLKRKRRSGELPAVRVGVRAIRYRSFDVERWESRLKIAK